MMQPIRIIPARYLRLAARLLGDGARATFSTAYKDDEALAMLNETVHPVHAYNPLVQIGDAKT